MKKKTKPKLKKSEEITFTFTGRPEVLERGVTIQIIQIPNLQINIEYKLPKSWEDE